MQFFKTFKLWLWVFGAIVLAGLDLVFGLAYVLTKDLVRSIRWKLYIRQSQQQYQSRQQYQRSRHPSQSLPVEIHSAR